MKFLPTQDFENITKALNFSTADTQVVGGLDLYTTKPGNSDKKLYKEISNSIESEHEAHLEYDRKYPHPDPDWKRDTLRLTAFGSLNDVAPRRAFAYMIATLNESHPDYDFVNILKPTDFKREANLLDVTERIDKTMWDSRPVPPSALLAVPNHNGKGSNLATPGGNYIWSPKMWPAIDKEMDLNQCDVYTCKAVEDVFDEDDNAVWSLSFFFFNRTRKRVAYLYARGLSLLSSSPSYVLAPRPIKRCRPISQDLLQIDDGARKRAKFWFGPRVSSGWDMEADDGGYDDGDYAYSYDSYANAPVFENYSETESDDDEMEKRRRERSKSAVRGMNDHMVENMEL